MNFTLTSEEQWSNHFDDIFSVLSKSNILCIEGDLGAGKTTFCKHFCAYLGSPDMVQSPTYSLIHEYTYTSNNQTRRIYHLDLYRLQTPQELLDIGIEEILNSGEICLIEWPKLLYPLIDDYLLVQITVEKSNLRKVNFRVSLLTASQCENENIKK